MNIPERNEMIDLFVREIDGSVWSEGCFFRLSEEEQDKVWEFIKEYNKDGHLDLLCIYDRQP